LGLNPNSQFTMPDFAVKRIVRFPAVSTVIGEPGVYWLGAMVINPGRVGRGGHVYGSTNVMMRAEPTEAQILRIVADKHGKGYWRDLIDRRLLPIQNYRQASSGAN
jgi:hypothetical protein